MKFIRCDRCKKEVESYTNVSFQKGLLSKTDYDFCDSCYHLLVGILERYLNPGMI